MHLCLFEDLQSNNLLPLTYFRPVYDLRCGMLSLRERIVRYLSPKSVSLFAREYLAAVLREDNPGVEVNRVSVGACLFVNGRAIMTPALARQLKKTKADTLYTTGDELVAVLLSGENLVKAMASGYADAIDLSHIRGVPRVEVEAELVHYPWDLVYANETALPNDFALLTKNAKGISRKADVHKAAVLVARKNIHIGKESVVGAGAVLDASEGPIYVGNSVKIFPTAVIQGP